MQDTSTQNLPPLETPRTNKAKQFWGISRKNAAPTFTMVGFLVVGAAMVICFWDMIFFEDARHSHIFIGAPSTATARMLVEPEPVTFQNAAEQFQHGEPFSELWLFPLPIKVGPEISVQLFAIEPEVASAVGIESMKDDMIYTDAGNTPQMSLRVPKLQPSKTPNRFEHNGYVDFGFRSLNVLHAEKAIEHMETPTNTARAFVTEATFFKIASSSFDMTPQEFEDWQSSPEGNKHSLISNCLAKIEKFEDLRLAKKALRAVGYDVSSW